jgi:adenylyltransferase/sulfurtransferase
LRRRGWEAAAERLGDLNPHVELDLYPVALTSKNALEILDPYDVVLDGTDNFPTRYLVNDACVLAGKPNVYGSIFRFEGQCSVFWAGRGPCYRCLYPEPPPPGMVPSCAEGGVLGVLPGLVGTLQATEALKVLLGIGEPLVGRLVLIETLGMHIRELTFARDAGCPVCGDEPTVTELIDYDAFCGVVNESDASELTPFEITPAEVKARIDRGDEFQLIDVRNPHELDICSIEGATLIPLPALPARMGELDPEGDIVIFCRSGKRSDTAVQYLRAQGFTRAKNMVGGVLRWSDEVDPTMAKY